MHPEDSGRDGQGEVGGDWETVRLRARGFEGTLQLALNATAEDAARWSAQEEDAEKKLPLIIPAHEAAATSTEWRLGWLATLVEVIASAYGVRVDANGDLEPVPDSDSPASLLREFLTRGGDAGPSA